MKLNLTRKDKENLKLLANEIEDFREQTELPEDISVERLALACLRLGLQVGLVESTPDIVYALGDDYMQGEI